MESVARKMATFPLAVKMVMIDLDGTLIDTVPDLAAAANRMLADLGRPVWDESYYRKWIGNGVPRFVKRALTGEMQAEPEAVLFEARLALFRKHYGAAVADLSRPYAGVVEGLERLRPWGLILPASPTRPRRSRFRC